MTNTPAVPDLPARFTKKPVTIEAIQWTGKLECLDPFDIPELHQSLGSSKVGIPTLEGTMIASVGDWIIKGVKGEFYPCKPDIFELSYEPKPATQPTPSGDAVEALREALEEIDRLAEGGLCQTSVSGVRAFHEDIRIVVLRALSTTSRAATVAKEGGEAHPMMDSPEVLDIFRAFRQAWSHAEAQAAERRMRAYIAKQVELATPKPEASAANQQAGYPYQELFDSIGEAVNIQGNAKAISVKAFVNALQNKGYRVAPISEGTDNLIGMEVSMDVSTGENDGTNRVFGRVEGVQAGTDGKPMILAFEESRNFPAAPAASNGDALPKAWGTWTEGDKLLTLYTQEQVLELLAARAGTGSAGSGIGEDKEFLRKLAGVIYAKRTSNVVKNLVLLDERKAELIAYIDRWADTRATKVEAAPGNAGEGV